MLIINRLFMNWYKKANFYLKNMESQDKIVDEIKPQYERYSQYELTMMIKPLIPIYRNFLDKQYDKIITPEEEKKMIEIGAQIDAMNQVRREKVHLAREQSKKDIQLGKSYKVSPFNFIDYHRTGGISESAYEMYEDKKGVSWLGTPEKYPIIVKKKEYGGEIIEFRKKDEKLMYTQTKDPSDEYSDFLRDKDGNLIYMTDEQVLKKGLPFYDTSITAFNESGEPIGWASDEFGADGVWVIKEYQGRGIGTDLLYEFRKQFKPGRKIGQMTHSGEAMTRSYHKKLIENALKEGKDIPLETLKYYELV